MKKTLVIVLLIMSSTLFSQSRIYVDIDATGNNDGTSWADAYTNLQTAIDESASNDTLWIAEGNYVPVPPPIPGAIPIFDIYRPLKIYGGFQGNETQLNQRDYLNHVTVLNGDINGDDDYNGYPFNPSNPTRDDNSPRVVAVTGNNVVLDGLSIRNGHSTIAQGCGVYVDGTSVSNFRLTNCELSYNSNSSINAGILIDLKNNSVINISNNRFHHNSANTATGIYAFTSTPGINVTLDIVNNLFYDQRIEAIGNLFSGSAGWVRAYEDGSNINLSLWNNTFANNYITVPTTGGRIPTIFGVSKSTINTTGGMNSDIANNIFWDNIVSNGAIPSSISSVIENGTAIGTVWTDSPNIAEDQLFYLPGDPGIITPPLFSDPSNNDYSLTSGSPARDAGNNLYIMGQTDVFGNARVVNGIVDLGAIEFSPSTNSYFVTTTVNPIAGGSVSGGGSYASGSNVTLTATPNANYNFDSWTENGTVGPPLSTNSSYSFTLNSNRDIIANFELIVSVEELQNNDMQVYPNPTDGLVKVEMNNFSSLEVYSVTGELLVKSETNQFDLRQYPKGVYILKIMTQDNQLVNRRIIKK